jgi:hypothetical protein
VKEKVVQVDLRQLEEALKQSCAGSRADEELLQLATVESPRETEPELRTLVASFQRMSR